MKKLLLFLAFPILGVSAQIEGTWKLAPQAGALAVGPALNNLTWFSSSLGDVTTRACLFDDSIKFEPGGVMTHYMDGSTWLEDWQGGGAGSCGTPLAPHVGGAATYAYDATAGTLTVNGLGAHIGLAKVFNGGELNTANPTATATAITYNVVFSNGGNTMTVQINFGPGWWQYVYQKTLIINPPTPNVTFKVDMSQYTGPAYAGVFVNGTFNGWNGTSNPMSDANMDGVWETTVPIGAGAIEYKFTLDGWSGQETLIPGSSCTITTGENTNRSYTVTGDAVLGTVCYNSCTACANDVTFKVDMTQSSMPAGSIPEVNGTFNNWCGNCNAMTDVNSDGIWETTISLAAGMYEYKFSYSAWTGQETLVPGSSCTITTGANTNRSLTVGSEAVVLPIVCWNSCSACPGPTNVFDDIIAVSPNHTYLEAALIQAGLDVALQNPASSLTVFAPDDAAITALVTALGTTISGLLANPLLSDILLYHVVGSQVLSTALVNGPVVTLNGASVIIDLTSGVMVNTATVTTADLLADNGVVHVINSVLVPPNLNISEFSISDLQLYPNPSIDVIKITNSVVENYSILSSNGVIVSSGKVINNEISVSHLDAGIYFLNLTVKGESQTIRIIKN